MLGQSLDGNEILNVKWANDDPNVFVKEYKKRKAEEQVKKAILSKLPQVGDKGTILDYENAYEDPDKKIRSLDGTGNYPFYQDANHGLAANHTHNVSNQDTESLKKAWEAYYAQGGTPEAAAAYYAQMDPNAYAQYYQQATSTPQNSDSQFQEQNIQQANNDATQYSYSYEQQQAFIGGNDNSMYAIASNKTKTSIPTDVGTVEENNAIETVPPMSGLVAYASDDEDD